MSDERKDRKLIAEAREWSRIVEASVATDWRKGYVEDGLYHVARLSDALEAVLAPQCETKVLERLKQLEREREFMAAALSGKPDAELRELLMAGRGDELEELRKAAKSVLLAYAAGREPETRQWARLANALDTEKRG